MARINGTEQPIKKAAPLTNSGGFDAMSNYNYILDDFSNIHGARCWPMVEDTQSCIDSIEKLITKKRLKMISEKGVDTTNLIIE